MQVVQTFLSLYCTDHNALKCVEGGHQCLPHSPTNPLSGLSQVAQRVVEAAKAVNAAQVVLVAPSGSSGGGLFGGLFGGAAGSSSVIEQARSPCLALTDITHAQ